MEAPTVAESNAIGNAANRSVLDAYAQAQNEGTRISLTVILSIRVLKTFVGGKVVYDAETDH